MTWHIWRKFTVYFSIVSLVTVFSLRHACSSNLWTNLCDPRRQCLCSGFRESYPADRPPQQVKQHGLSLLYREVVYALQRHTGWCPPVPTATPPAGKQHRHTCTHNATDAVTHAHRHLSHRQGHSAPQDIRCTYVLAQMDVCRDAHLTHKWLQHLLVWTEHQKKHIFGIFLLLPKHIDPYWQLGSETRVTVSSFVNNLWGAFVTLAWWRGV